MNSSRSSACVQDASLLSRRPRLAEIDRPDAQMPGKPASSTIFAERPLCASIRKLKEGEQIAARKAANLLGRTMSARELGASSVWGERIISLKSSPLYGLAGSPLDAIPRT